MQNKKSLKKGFTLLEITVAITVFAIVMITISSTFILIQDSWRRQKVNWDMLQNANWALTFISNEVKLMQSFNKPKSSQPSSNRLVGHVDLDGDGSDDLQVRYKLNGNTLERGWKSKGGPGGYGGDDDDTGWQYSALSENIVNPANTLFTCDAAEKIITINIIVRPYPLVAEGTNNRNFTLKTTVRARNIKD